MKALMCHSFGPIDNLRVEDVELPAPAAGQVLIDVHAASINYPDSLIVQGRYQVKPELPFTPGMELAGVMQPSPAPKFSRCQTEVRHPPRPAGYDTEAVLQNAGYSAEAIQQLREQGALS